MVDKLQVDLIAGNASKAISEVQKFRQTFIDTSATIENLPGISALDKQVVALTNRADAARRSFQDIVKFDTAGNGLDAVSRSAIRLQKEALSVQQRLRDIAAVNKAGKSET